MLLGKRCIMFHVFGEGKVWVKMHKPTQKKLCWSIQKDLIFSQDIKMEKEFKNKMMELGFAFSKIKNSRFGKGLDEISKCIMVKIYVDTNFS